MKQSLLAVAFTVSLPAAAATRGLPSGPAMTPTKNNPARFHVRIDGSPSMGWNFSEGVTRAEAARQATNRLLFSLVSANIVGSDIHDRATVTVKGYHTECPEDGTEKTRIENLLAPAARRAKLDVSGTGEYSLSDLATMIPDDLPEGAEPVWIEHPYSALEGRTPTRKTMRALADSVTSDVKGRAVFLVHLSDGESSDGEFAPEVHRWATNVIQYGGSPLATNIFISETGKAAPLIFPTPEEAESLLKADPHFRQMWEASSEMPDAMARRIDAEFPDLKIKEGEHRRLIAYQVTGLEQLKAVFKAGSSSAAGF